MRYIAPVPVCRARPLRPKCCPNLLARRVLRDFTRDRPLLVGVRRNQAGIDREPLGGSSAVADADTATTTTPAEPFSVLNGTNSELPLVDRGGQQNEDAEDKEGSASSQPSDHNEPIFHGNAPAASSPTDPEDNKPQVPEVPPQRAHHQSKCPEPAASEVHSKCTINSCVIRCAVAVEARARLELSQTSERCYRKSSTEVVHPEDEQ
jgi:hypothetical protein